MKRAIGPVWDPGLRRGLRWLLLVAAVLGFLMAVGGLYVWRVARRPTTVVVPPPVPHAALSPLSSTAPVLPSPTSTVVLDQLTPTGEGREPTGVPSPTPESPAAVFPVPSDVELRAQIERMPLEEKIGQMMMAGFDGQRLASSPDLPALISTYRVGGLVLLEANAHDPQQVAALVSDAQHLAMETGSGLPLLVAINHEGGYIVRITEGVTGFPGNMAIAASGKPEYAFTAAALEAQELRAMGINMNLAPVLDVNDNPLNPVIGVRSFGESPELVAHFGQQTIRGFEQNGVIAVAKHFPGHGNTAVDSHVGLPTIARPVAELERVELAPFRAAVAEGVEAIMTAHIVVPALEPTPDLPATLSTAILTGLLRERMGFDGLIISDSLGMGAIASGWGQGPAAVRAVQAGIDIVLSTGPLEEQAAIARALIAAAQRGEIPTARIDEAVLRILRVKHKYGLWTWAAGLDLSIVGSPAHQAVADQMALASITLFKDEEGLVPLPADVRQLLVLSPADLPPDASGEGTLLGQRLRESGLEVTELVYDLDRQDSRSAVYAQAVQAASQHDAILFGEWEWVKRAANSSDRWQGTLVDALLQSGRPLLVISWHDPGAIMLAPQVPSFLIAYGTTPAQVRAVVQVLVGQAPPQGHLPLTLVQPTGAAADGR